MSPVRGWLACISAMTWKIASATAAGRSWWMRWPLPSIIRWRPRGAAAARSFGRLVQCARKSLREALGGAERHDQDVRERPGGGAQFPQHRGARRNVAAAQLITPGRAGEPERPPGQAVGHLLMRGID
jgi:hypothetical protein